MGVVVAVEGLDGAGKATLVAALADAARARGATVGAAVVEVVEIQDAADVAVDVAAIKVVVDKIIHILPPQTTITT